LWCHLDVPVNTDVSVKRAASNYIAEMNTALMYVERAAGIEGSGTVAKKWK